MDSYENDCNATDTAPISVNKQCEVLSDGQFVVYPGCVDIPAARQQEFQLVQCSNPSTHSRTIVAPAGSKERWFCDDHRRM
jgi:hypothetical protein